MRNLTKITFAQTLSNDLKNRVDEFSDDIKESGLTPDQWIISEAQDNNESYSWMLNDEDGSREKYEEAVWGDVHNVELQWEIQAQIEQEIKRILAF